MDCFSIENQVFLMTYWDAAVYKQPILQQQTVQAPLNVPGLRPRKGAINDAHTPLRQA